MLGLKPRQMMYVCVRVLDVAVTLSLLLFFLDLCLSLSPSVSGCSPSVSGRRLEKGW